MNSFALAVAALLVSGSVFASSVPVTFKDTDHDFDFAHHDNNLPDFNQYAFGTNHNEHAQPGSNNRESGRDHLANIPFEFNTHFDLTESSAHGGFNPHQGYELAGLRNFHAEGRGLQGLTNARYHINAVPVPAAGWLFMSGLVGMIAVTRRQKQRKI